MSGGGLSEARLGRMHDAMAGHVERGDLPGLVTLVSRRGQIYVDAVGTLAVGGAEPMRRDTIFRIASMTKPIAAVATLILVEDGTLGLDEPVDRLLPELAERRVLARADGPLDDTVPANRPITVRDLLTSRPGFGFDLELAGDAPIEQAIAERGLAPGPHPPAAPSPDAWIGTLGTLPLLHQPGEAWLYETAFDALGVLIARAAGRPLEVFLRERIFEPLGMGDTAFSVPPDKLDRLPPCYASDPDIGALQLLDAARDGLYSRPPGFPSGAGGLVSTVDDYLAFGQMMLNRGALGSERILSRASVELMTTDHLTPEQRSRAAPLLDGHGWGFGVSVAAGRDGEPTIPGGFGWDGGYGTSWRSDPEKELVAIQMTQWCFPQSADVMSDFWTSAYAALDD